MQYITRLFRFVTILASSAFLMAAEGPDPNVVQVQMMAAFSDYVDWPAGASPKVSGNLNICIMGENPFGSALQTIENRTSPNYSFSVTRDITEDRLPQCHIVFVSRTEDYKLNEIMKLLKQWPIFTISDTRNFANRGGMIAFVLNQGKIGFKVNTQNITQAGLRIDGDLLNAATEVVK